MQVRQGERAAEWFPSRARLRSPLVKMLRSAPVIDIATHTTALGGVYTVRRTQWLLETRREWTVDMHWSSGHV